MLSSGTLKKTAILTAGIFLWFALGAGLSWSGQGRDNPLSKARQLIKEGEYQGAIKMLEDYIGKIKQVLFQKKRIAEAYYIIAKIYYIVGEDNNTDINLKRVFETYPGFSIEESDMAFLARVNKIKNAGKPNPQPIPGPQPNRDAQKAAESARQSFDSGNFQEALTQARTALSLDAGHAEAARIFLSASQKLAQSEIKTLVDGYVQALKAGAYENFYRMNCTPGLYQKITKDTELLFSVYSDIQASASNLTVVFKETSLERLRAEASFFHILTGKSRKTGTRQILFEGLHKWSLEKTGESWLLTDIQFDVRQK
jgi:tetratricopeptide (TPR) repeat protein